MTDRLTLTPRRWYGWQYLGAAGAAGSPFSATPAFIGDVHPLKSGNSLLELDVVLALRPLRALRERAQLRVTYRGEHAVVARHDELSGAGEVLITPITIPWLEQHCTRFWDRVGARATCYADSSQPQEVLGFVLGNSIETAANGATASSFGESVGAFSGKAGNLPFEREYSGLDAWLILRGAVPRDMDERWFIYTEFTDAGGTINFRRGWTCHLIFQVDFQFAGCDGITTLGARVNLDKREYGFGTPDEETSRLDGSIHAILLGRGPLESPHGDTPGRLVDWHQATDVAGSPIASPAPSDRLSTG